MNIAGVEGEVTLTLWLGQTALLNIRTANHSPLIKLCTLSA
jgi:hypothetical protein